jgi:hypothetical protein
METDLLIQVDHQSLLDHQDHQDFLQFVDPRETLQLMMYLRRHSLLLNLQEFLEGKPTRVTSAHGRSIKIWECGHLTLSRASV